MLNRNFGKLENGALVYAPSPLIIDGLQAFTNDAVILLSHGYKPIVQTDAPTQTGYHAVASWTESATQITQTWTLVEDGIVGQYRCRCYAFRLLTILLRSF